MTEVLRAHGVSPDHPSFKFSLLRDAVRTELISSGILDDDAYVVIAGPANTYSHYVATLEEYSVQRYEGPSTIYGQCKSISDAPLEWLLI